MKCAVCGRTIYSYYGDKNLIICKDCIGTEEAKKLKQIKAGVVKQKDSNSEKSNFKTTKIEEKPKYFALLTISNFYKTLAMIVAIVAIIALIYGLSLLAEGYRSRATGITLIIYSLFSGLFGVISFLAISEIIKLFIDLESNSRQQINLLKKIIDKN